MNIELDTNLLDPSEIEDQIEEAFAEYQNLLSEIESRESESPAFVRLREKADRYGDHLDDLDIESHELRMSLLREYREVILQLRRDLERPALRLIVGGPDTDTK